MNKMYKYSDIGSKKIFLLLLSSTHRVLLTAYLVMLHSTVCAEIDWPFVPGVLKIGSRSSATLSRMKL